MTLAVLDFTQLWGKYGAQFCKIKTVICCILNAWGIDAYLKVSRFGVAFAKTAGVHVPGSD